MRLRGSEYPRLRNESAAFRPFPAHRFGASRLPRPAAIVAVAAAALLAAVALAGGGPGGAPGSGDGTGPSASAPIIAVGATPAGSLSAGGPSPSATNGEPGPSAPPIGGGPGAGDPAGTAIPAARLQARLDALRVRYAIPGISATIRFPDGTSWTGTSGFADVAAKAPVRAETAFAAASMSKTFLAALVLELAEEGRLGLDDRASAWLPDRRLPATITIRQLLDHTSGLHDFFFGKGIDAALLADRSAEWSTNRTLGFVGKPYFKPGRGFHYSNTNYLILGLIAEKASGTSLARNYRARFLVPLGMQTAYYQAAEKPEGPIAHGYRFASSSTKAKPIDLSDGSSMMPFTSVVTAADGAGSVAASSADLARWAEALYGGSILTGPSFREMVDGAARTLKVGAKYPYGLGVQELTIGRFATLGHSGRLLGFQGAMRYLPVERVSIAVVTNQSRRDPAPIVRALLEIALPLPAPCDLGCD